MAADVEVERCIARGREFLAGMFDSSLDLLPEYRGAKVYWLFHDNYLAAKLLDSSRPELSAKIRAAIATRGAKHSGKIEILFGEAPNPLPFRHYVLSNVVVIDGKTIRTEVVTDRVLKGWEEYADLRLFAAIAQARSAPAEARRDFDRAAAMWDGRGLNDRVTQHGKRYATYKLALFLIADARLQAKSPLAPAVQRQLLALQHRDGGWITDYDSDGKPRGLANVETTCMALLALQTAPGATGK